MLPSGRRLMRATSADDNSRSKVRLADTSLSITRRSCGAPITPSTVMSLSQYPQLPIPAIRRRRSTAASAFRLGGTDCACAAPALSLEPAVDVIDAQAAASARTVVDKTAERNDMCARELRLPPQLHLEWHRFQ